MTWQVGAFAILFVALAGGTYFATETARILGGAGGALRPEDGIALLKATSEVGA